MASLSDAEYNDYGGYCVKRDAGGAVIDYKLADQSGTTANPTNSGTSAKPTDTGGTNQPTNSGTSGKQYLQNPLKNVNSLEDLLGIILDAVVQLGSIILVMALVWVGAQFVFARGNEEQLKSARASLTWTVIGGVVLLGAQAIAMVIKSTAGALQ